MSTFQDEGRPTNGCIAVLGTLALLFLTVTVGSMIWRYEKQGEQKYIYASKPAHYISELHGELVYADMSVQKHQNGHTYTTTKHLILVIKSNRGEKKEFKINTESLRAFDFDAIKSNEGKQVTLKTQTMFPDGIWTLQDSSGQIICCDHQYY